MKINNNKLQTIASEMHNSLEAINDMFVANYNIVRADGKTISVDELLRFVEMFKPLYDYETWSLNETN